MSLNVCWSAKGGSGTTVVAAALALGSNAESLLIDLDGELPAALGVPEPSGQCLSDWFASDAPPRAVLDLAVTVAERTRLVARGPVPVPRDSPRWPELRQFLVDTSVEVVVDAGRGTPPPDLLDARVRSLLVTRACYLALARGCRLPRPDGIVLLEEPGRSLTAADVARALGAPVVARITVDPAVARAVDAGLLAARLPQGMLKALQALQRRVMRGMSSGTSATPVAGRDVDDRLVAALCRAAEGEPGSAEMAVREHVGRLAPLAGPDERERLVGAAVARLDGLGPLDALVRDRSIDEVLVNGEGEVWVDRHGALARAGWITAAELAVVTERILAPLGRRLDRTTPIVDARLADGTRVCAVVPPISVDGAVLSLRRFGSEPLPLTAFGPDAVVAALGELVERRCNVVVSGATSSGKTSLLNSLLGLVPPGERLVLLEDTAELAPRCDHVVRLEARPASNDGLAAITVEHLLHTALRLRPDRLVVGEVRGPEVLGLVQALNTGHDGSWSTCHANSALDALHRLETLVVQTAPAWPLRAIRDHLLRCIDAVVHVERAPGGGRRVAEIAEVIDGDGVPAVRPIVSGGARVADLSRTRVTPP